MIGPRAKDTEFGMPCELGKPQKSFIIYHLKRHFLHVNRFSSILLLNMRLA